MKLAHLIFLILSLIIITLPRFNWGELGPLKSLVGVKPFDVEQYILYTNYFRGEKNSADLEGPFAYRPLVPYLASFLPFKALTSINLINLIFLIITLFPLIGLLKLLNFRGNYLLLGCVLFIFSFPVFYYGTSGYIDAALITLIMTGTYFIFNEKILLFMVTLILGMLVKETIVILIPVFAVYLFLQKKILLGKKILLVMVIVIIYGTGTFLLRALTPGSEIYVWYPSIKILLKNLVRGKTYLSIFLTLGLPGFVAMYYIFKKYPGNIKLKNEVTLITGVLVSILISLFSLFAAYADGRHIWTSYPFTIPLTLMYLKSMKQPRKLLSKLFDS